MIGGKSPVGEGAVRAEGVLFDDVAHHRVQQRRIGVEAVPGGEMQLNVQLIDVREEVRRTARHIGKDFPLQIHAVNKRNIKAYACVWVGGRDEGCTSQPSQSILRTVTRRERRWPSASAMSWSSGRMTLVARVPYSFVVAWLALGAPRPKKWK